MSIQKRITANGQTRWIARWRDPAGKSRSKSFDTRREAKAHADEMERRRRRGNYLPHEDESITVKELFTRWIHSRPLRPESRKLYEHTRDKLLGPWADYPARSLTTQDVHEWADALANGRRWYGKDDKGLGPQSVRNAMRHLRSAMKWGVENELVPRNPVKIPPMSQAVEPDEIPTLAEIQLVINQVRNGGARYIEHPRSDRPVRELTQKPNPILADMLTTAAMTGMRISELAGLLVREVDLDAGIIRVRKQLGKTEPRQRVELKTPSSRRDIPIAPELLPVLRRMVQDRAPDAYVFTNEVGSPIHNGRAAVAVRRAREHVGANRVHFHALRHYFASTLITAGVPIQDVAAVLGHRSPALTLKVYTHVVEGARDRVVDAISSAIGCGIRVGSPDLRVIAGGA